MFDWLFSEQGFRNRSECMNWPQDLKLVYQWSNMTIAVCYFAIPIMLAILYWKKRKDAPSSWMLICFFFFILFCGVTHANEVLVFYFAAYRYYTLVYLLTGIFSLATVILMPRWLSKVIGFRSAEQYESMIATCEQGLRERDLYAAKLQESNTALQDKIGNLLRRIDEKDWYLKTHEEARDLQRILLNATMPSAVAVHVEAGGKPC